MNTTTTTKTLKRIAPLQFGKILGALYGIMGLIFVPFILLASAIGAFASNHGDQPHAAGALLGAGLGIGFALMMVIGYAVLGFIGGIIAACLYNLLAGFLGGIQVEVE